jgi:hypothetical protein
LPRSILPFEENIVTNTSLPEPPTFSLDSYKATLLAGFDVLEPTYIPQGYFLEGVAYDPWTRTVTTKYTSQDGGSMLITQQQGDLLHYPDSNPFLTHISVRGVTGEFIQGEWTSDTPPIWDETADIYSLSWQETELVFSINITQSEENSSVLQSELLAIAESMK